MMPVAAAQAVLAGPLVRLIFPPRWEPSIPIFVILSLAIGFAVLASSAGNLLMAQGRFATKVRLNVFHLLLFVALVGPAALSGAVMVAWGVLAFWIAAAIVNPLVALYGTGIRPLTSIQPLSCLVILTAGAFAPMSVMLTLTPTLSWPLLSIAVLFSLTFYGGLLWWLQRHVLISLTQRLRQLIGRSRHSIK